MTEDSSWSAGPRRSADVRTSFRAQHSVEQSPGLGRRAAYQDDNGGAPRRGARRSADSPSDPDFSRGLGLDDETQSSYHERPRARLHRDPARRHWEPPVPRSPQPSPEPASNVWAAAAARNRAAAEQEEQGTQRPSSDDAPDFHEDDAPDFHEKDIAAATSTTDEAPEPARVAQPAADRLPHPHPGRSRWGRRKLYLSLICLLLAVLLIGGIWVVLNRDQLPRGLSGESPNGPGADASTTNGTPENESTPASPDPENTEGAQAASEELKLNDTRLTPPAGWNLYGDEMIEDVEGEADRRVIRLSNSDTDIRLQVISVTSAGGDLGAACEGLSANQQGQFSDVTRSATVSVGVDPAQGAGFSCGFHGIRTTDGVASTVTFTLVLRTTDGHVLMLRNIIPDSVVAGAASRQELAAMNCTASLNFGVTLPLC